MGSCSFRRSTGFPVARGPDRDAERVQRRDPIEKVRQAFVDRQPIGRLGKAEEIAAIAVDLAPDRASSPPAKPSSSAAALRRGVIFPPR
jgi:hypothetical protein